MSTENSEPRESNGPDPSPESAEAPSQADRADGDPSAENPASDEPAEEETGAAPESEVAGDTAEQSDKSESTAKTEVEGEDDSLEDEPLTPELVEEEAMRADFMLAVAAVLLAFLMGSTEIAEPATLRHLKTGQYIAENSFLPPRTDVFSYTIENQPWANLNWLFDLMLAGVYGAGGAAGLSVFKALVAAVAFFFLVQIFREGISTWWGSLCAVGTLVAVHQTFTAQPQLVTILGLVLTLWIVHSWKESGTSNRIWWLVPLMLVWGNLDPRMFLGLCVLVLYGLGDLIGLALDRPGLTGEQRKQIRLVTVACFAAALVHPFGFRTLLSPFFLYGTEYPAHREYLFTSGILTSSDVRYFPLFSEQFLERVSYTHIAALCLFAASTTLLVLNRKRLDYGHLLLHVGFAVLAIFCAQQLAAAAIVFCMLAALYGQDWYAANFSMEYTLDTRELIFSRLGRVLTVLVFALLALVSGTGRLVGGNGPFTGYGFDYMFAGTVKAMRDQLRDEDQQPLTFSDRGFNFVPAQGDLLIWADQKVFIDSRLGLYRAANKGLIAKHHRTRLAIRGTYYSKETVVEQQQAVEQDLALWPRVFSEYQISYAVPRLTTEMHYRTLLNMLLTFSNDWQLTGLGGSVALFHHRDADNEKLAEFLEAHQLDITRVGFLKDLPAPRPREVWVRAPTFYEQHVWSPRKRIPNAVLEAEHFLELARRIGQPGLAYHAIRRALDGLAEEPNCANGYVVLGNAYMLLVNAENSNPAGTSPWVGNTVRYYQSVQAFNQALIADPENAEALYALWRLYLAVSPPRVDLALRSSNLLDEVLSQKPNANKDDVDLRVELNSSKEQLTKQRNAALEEIETAKAGGEEHLQLVGMALRKGLFLEGLRLLEEQQLQFGNPAAQNLYLSALFDAGRTQDAFNAVQRLAGSVEQNQLPSNWQTAAAVTYLANANYEAALLLWAEDSRRIAAEWDASLLNAFAFGDSMCDAQSVHVLRPKRSELPWPVSQMAAFYSFQYQRPQSLSNIALNQAHVQLEGGQTKKATATLKRLLELDPNTPRRDLIAIHLRQLTGERIELIPPANRVPILFAPEDGEKDVSIGDDVMPVSPDKE